MRRFFTSSAGSSAETLDHIAATLLAGLLAGLLTGCSGWAKDQPKPDPYKVGALPAVDVVAKGKAVGHWVKDGDDKLRFTGTIVPGSAAELTAALAAAPKVTTVEATVSGGDLGDGLTIGQTLHDHKLALALDGACVGPCADYWFPAAAKRSATSGSWLGYVQDFSEAVNSSAQQRTAEAKLYTDSGVDVARFHSAMDAELRETPGQLGPAPVAFWMPDTADLVGIGYPAAALTGVWLPPNLTSANAQAHAWGDIVAYKNTLVGLPPVPSAAPSGVPAPPTPTAPAKPAVVVPGAPAGN